MSVLSRTRRRSSPALEVGWCWHAGVLTCVALIAACSGQAPQVGGQAASSPPATALSAPSPDAVPTGTASPPVDEEAAVLAAYLKFWETYFAANQDPPGASLDDLALHATGDVVAAVRTETEAHREAGRVFRRPPDSVASHAVSDVRVEGDRATVRDCEVNDGWVESVASGERINEGTVTRLGTATLLREGGRWKVADTVVEQTWEGVAGCAAR